MGKLLFKFQGSKSTTSSVSKDSLQSAELYLAEVILHSTLIYMYLNRKISLFLPIVKLFWAEIVLEELTNFMVMKLLILNV